MVNVKEAAQSVEKLSMLRFFPAGPNAQAGIVQLACEMAKSNAQIDWLVDRMLKIYNEWPGPREMRACFCNRYPPADGVSACSDVYPEGSFPKDPTAPSRIEAPKMLALPPGATVSVDPVLDAAIVAGAEVLKMPEPSPVMRDHVASSRFGKILKEITTPPRDRPMRPAPEPISEARGAEIQAQIDAVLAERRRA